MIGRFAYGSTLCSFSIDVMIVRDPFAVGEGLPSGVNVWMVHFWFRRRLPAPFLCRNALGFPSHSGEESLVWVVSVQGKASSMQREVLAVIP